MLKSRGFTLIELMAVVVVIGIFFAIAMPSYQSVIRKNTESKVQQSVLKLASDLERHKARNYNYKNFVITGIDMPMGYSINIFDLDNTSKSLSQDVQGRGWYIKVAPPSDDPKAQYFLMSSTGLRCKSIIESNVNFKCEPTVTESDGSQSGSQPW